MQLGLYNVAARKYHNESLQDRRDNRSNTELLRLYVQNLLC